MAKQSNWQYYTSKLPAPLRNKYVLTVGLFVIWMLFFDRFSVMEQISLQQTKSELESKLYYYKVQNKETQEQQEAIHTSNATLEKAVREKFLMKRKDEVLFVIEEEKDPL